MPLFYNLYDKCDNSYMIPVALLKDRAGAGPNDPTSSRFLELGQYICYCTFDFEYKQLCNGMRSHFIPACCIINNKGERTLFHCVLLCVGHETRDKVSYLLVYKFQIKLFICLILISILTSQNEAMVYPPLTLNYSLFRKSASSGGDNINSWIENG